MANKKNKQLGKVIGQSKGAQIRVLMESRKVSTGKLDRSGKPVEATKSVPSGKIVVCHGKKIVSTHPFNELETVKELINE